jgi:hypothetical protein
MHPTRALSEKAINFWNVTFGSEVVVEVSERLRKMLQKLETDAPEAIKLPELAPLGSGASLAAALKRNSQPSSLVEMEDSDEDEASDDEPATSPACQAGPTSVIAGEAGDPILVAVSSPPPLSSLDDSRAPGAGDDDIASTSTAAQAVSAQQPGDHTATSADEEMCEIQLVDEKDIQNEDEDDGVEHELNATDEGRHVDVSSSDAGDETFAIISPSHSFSPPVSPPPPMRKLPGSSASSRKSPVRQPARRSKRKTTKDAAEREGDMTSPRKRRPAQSTALTPSEGGKVKGNGARREPTAKKSALSSEGDQAPARAVVGADTATTPEADAVAENNPPSPAPRGTLAPATDPVPATSEEKDDGVLSNPVPERRASSEPPAPRPAAEGIPESAAVQAARSELTGVGAAVASGNTDAAHDQEVDVLPSLVRPNTSPAPASAEGEVGSQDNTKPRNVLIGVDADASPPSDRGGDPHAQVPLRRPVSLERRPSIGGSRRANLIASMAMGSQAQLEPVDAVERSESKESVEAKRAEAQSEATRKKRNGAARGNAGGVLSVGSKRAKRILQSLSAGRIASELVSSKDSSEEAAAAEAPCEAPCDSSPTDDPGQISTPLEGTAAGMADKEATANTDLANEAEALAARRAKEPPTDAQDEAEAKAREPSSATEAGGTVCASAGASGSDASAGPWSPPDSSGGAAALPSQASSLVGAAGVAQAGASSVDNNPGSKADRSAVSGQRGGVSAGANESGSVLRPLPEKTPSREPDVEQTTPKPPSSAQAPPGAPAGKSAARRLANNAVLSVISNDGAATLDGGKEAEESVECDAERGGAPTPLWRPKAPASAAAAAAAAAPQPSSSPPPESPPATAAAEVGAASSDMPTISTQSQLEMEEVLGKVMPGSPGHRSRAKRSFIGRVGNGALSPRKLTTSWLSKSKRHPVAAPSALPDPTNMVVISGRHSVAARKLTEHQRERRAEQREAARATLTYGELDTHVSKASLDASFVTQEEGESQAEAVLSPVARTLDMRTESPASTTDARRISSASLTPPSPPRRPLQGPDAGDSEPPTPSTPTISPPGILKRWSPKRAQSPGARLRTRRVSFNLESNTSHILPELELDDAAGAYGPFGWSVAKPGRPRTSLGLGRQRAGPARRRTASMSKGSPRGHGLSPPQAAARRSSADRREAESAKSSSSAPWTNVATSGSKAEAANNATSEAAADTDGVRGVTGTENRTSASVPMRLSFLASAGMRKRSRLGTPRRASSEKPVLQNRSRQELVAVRTADEQPATAARAAKPGAAAARLDGAEAGEQEDALLHREHSQPVKRSLRMAMLEADPPAWSAPAHAPTSEAASSTAERPAKRPHSAAREGWSSSLFAKKPRSAPGRLVGSSRARKLAALAQRTASMERFVTSETGHTQQSGDGTGAAPSPSRPAHATVSPFKGTSNRMETANGMAEMTPNTARTAHAGTTPLRTTSVVPDSGNTTKTTAKGVSTDQVSAGGAVSMPHVAADPAAGVRCVRERRVLLVGLVCF